MENLELLAGVGALIGSVISAFQIIGKWKEEHRNDRILDRTFQAARDRAEFLFTWYRARESVSGSEGLDGIRKNVKLQLDNIMFDTLMTVENLQPIPLSTRRRYLLMFLPRSAMGWLTRLCFLISFPVFVAIAVGVMLEAAEGRTSSLDLYMIILTLFGAPTAVFYLLSYYDGRERTAPVLVGENVPEPARPFVRARPKVHQPAQQQRRAA